MKFRSQTEKYAYWVNEAVRQVMYRMRGEAEIRRVLMEPAPSIDSLMQQAEYVQEIRAEISGYEEMARQICQKFRLDFAEVQAAALAEMIRRDVRQKARIEENLRRHTDPEP